MNGLLFGSLGADPAALAALFGHFLLLSLLAVGGAISTVPDMHRFVVVERGWLDDLGLTESVALAQAAPGPNVLFVAVIGWNVGGLAGMLATMVGSLLPSATLAVAAHRYGERRRMSRAVRAFRAGMAPLALGLLLSTGWVLTEPVRAQWGAMLLVAGTVAVMWRTRISPLWPIAAGALAGALGWV
ncbi:MAG: chromate transporter [Rubrivivax sp.]|nr:chromate transporter [Rubrivivax sp.]